MRSNQYDSVFYPLGLHMSWTISKIIRCEGKNTHTHNTNVRTRMCSNDQTTSYKRCTAIMTVFMFVHLQWQYVILTVNSTRQKILFLLPLINWLIFPSFSLWVSERRLVCGPCGQSKEQKQGSNEGKYVHISLFLARVFYKSKTKNTKSLALWVSAAFYQVKLVKRHARVSHLGAESRWLVYWCSIVFTVWWHS